jgi:hypothetical protein
MAKTNVKPAVKIPSAEEQKETLTGEQLRAQLLQNKIDRRDLKGLPKAKRIDEKHVLSEKMLSFTVIVDPLNIYKGNLGFLKYNRPDFWVFTNNVLTKMTANTHLPLPLPAPADIQVEIGLFNVAKAARLTSVANTHLFNVKYMMKQLAIWVANNCGNSFDIFTTSGFIANKLKPGPTKVIVKAVIRTVKKTAIEGQAVATVDAVPGANFYKGYWTLAGVPFNTVNATRGGAGVNVLFTGLPNLTAINLYVVASGPENDGTPSNPFPWPQV